MISPTGSFLLGTLSVLASGYIIYDAPILRLWLSKSAGYVLYFRIITTGLILVILSAVLLHPFTPNDVPILDFTLTPEHAPIVAFVVALGLRGLAEFGTSIYGKRQPKWKEKLNRKRLDEKGLDQFIYDRINNEEMIMVTLENKKVYIGWPLEAPNNEDNKWLRLTPYWSGYRDEESNVTVQVDYSTVFGTPPPDDRNRMLIPVEKIVTAQPFDDEIFKKFNPHLS